MPQQRTRKKQSECPRGTCPRFLSKSVIVGMEICLVEGLSTVQPRLRNDLYCVEWGVKLYSLTHRPTRWLAIATLIRRCCSRTSGLENVIMCVCQVSVPNKRRKQNCSLILLSHLCGSGRGYLRFYRYFICRGGRLQLSCGMFTFRLRSIRFLRGFRCILRFPVEARRNCKTEENRDLNRISVKVVRQGG